MSDITETLCFGEDDPRAHGDELMEQVYEELLALAQDKLKREGKGHMLQPTALVHEAYLKLVDQTRVTWRGRTHFYSVASMAMQRVLVDEARHRNREKRGGGWRRVTLDDAFSVGADRPLDMLALHEALERMATLDERQAKVMKLRLFGGLSVDETAELLDTSPRTVERDWKMGRAWLRRELRAGDE
ncbi:MAG: sigma-70 family RNA polymerase sigma factor [Planctomycetes bacterium]|nr:sigma-70 family RNA polymerase sigma factor [Planctomycetota bacterium]